MKRCPFCAEEIQDDAVKCRHCGEFSEASSRPAKTKWYFKTSALVIAILAVGPFALPLVWSNPNPKYTPIVKTIITVIVAIITVAATYYTVVAFSRVMDQMDAMLK